MRPIPLLAGLALLVGATAAHAQERAFYESVIGWQIERGTDVTGGRQCFMVRNYVDEDDNDADNAVTFAMDKKALVVVLKYSKWNYDADAKFVAATLFDGKVVAPKNTWTASGDRLFGQLPGALADKAAAADEISIKGKDWQASFDLHGAEDAFDALKRCNAGQKPN